MSKVAIISGMFLQASAFDQAIGGWDVLPDLEVYCRNDDLYSPCSDLFKDATAFSQCIPWHDRNSDACKKFEVCGSAAVKQSNYLGTISQSINGRTCQKWTSQKPNSHTRTPENYPGKGLGDHNYCRNPSDAPDGAWCYTTNGERWEYCDVPTCDNCGTSAAKQSDYRGADSVTINGRTCQEWTSTTPNWHTYTLENYPGMGLGDHNYCRNPSQATSGERTWCFTTDGPRWEYCDVPECDSTCGTSAAKQSDYRGTISETINERTCQKWTSTTPNWHTYTPEDYPGMGLGDHNYCRNPSDAPDGAWCYTTDGPRWEYCDVRTCRDGEAASKTSGTGSTPLIVLFCVLGAILLLGVVYFVRKRRAAVAQPDEVPQLCTEPDPSAAA